MIIKIIKNNSLVFHKQYINIPCLLKKTIKMKKAETNQRNQVLIPSTIKDQGQSFFGPSGDLCYSRNGSWFFSDVARIVGTYHELNILFTGKHKPKSDGQFPHIKTEQMEVQEHNLSSWVWTTFGQIWVTDMARFSASEHDLKYKRICPPSEFYGKNHIWFQ